MLSRKVVDRWRTYIGRKVGHTRETVPDDGATAGLCSVFCKVTAL